MVRLLSIGIECFSAMVFIIPVIIILQYAFFKQHNLSKLFMVFIFALYTMAVFSVTGIPTAYTLRVEFIFNFIPLIDIFHSPAGYIVNTLLNIILFMPMGFLLPAIWEEYRSAKKTVFVGLALSVIIELLQIFTFRCTDIDDLITNTLGTFLGYICGKIVSFKLPLKIPVSGKNNMTKYEPVIVLISVFFTAFLLKPALSNKIWDIVLSSPLWESIK